MFNFLVLHSTSNESPAGEEWPDRVYTISAGGESIANNIPKRILFIFNNANERLTGSPSISVLLSASVSYLWYATRCSRKGQAAGSPSGTLNDRRSRTLTKRKAFMSRIQSEAPSLGQWTSHSGMRPQTTPPSRPLVIKMTSTAWEQINKCQPTRPVQPAFNYECWLILP